MSFIYLPWGILIGLIMAAPIGPVNIICIRRAMTKGPANGYFVGQGAALADGFFGALAAFGLTGMTQLINTYNGLIQIIGAVALIIIGIKLWLSHPHVDDVDDTFSDPLKAATGTFLLTLTNPLTILGFVAIFVGLGFGDMGDKLINATLISTGILLGSSLWWGIVSFGAARLSRNLSDRHLENINKVSAGILFLFAIIALIKNIF
jgi:threonine/homoserine/homoserine lactone efflux protein